MRDIEEGSACQRLYERLSPLGPIVHVARDTPSTTSPPRRLFLPLRLEGLSSYTSFFFTCPRAVDVHVRQVGLYATFEGVVTFLRGAIVLSNRCLSLCRTLIFPRMIERLSSAERR